MVIDLFITHQIIYPLFLKKIISTLTNSVFKFFVSQQMFFMASSLCHSLVLVYFHASFSVFCCLFINC